MLRLLGDFDLAEDCLSEALETALRLWPEQGEPRSPGAWLNTVARRKALDVLRRQKLWERQLEHLVEEQAEEDDRLSLLFAVCHPALAPEARVALTLRAMGGLTTPEIARAFLVSESTMAQRIVRAQRKIRDAGIPFQVPAPERLQERLEGVLAVLYLIFNEGYYASGGEALQRADLCQEAIRLGELLVELMPREAEPAGLLALMLFQQSRSAARQDGLTLEEQDRSLWDRPTIDRGVLLMDRAMRMGRPGPYQIQAAIACFHCRAASAAQTDWPKIAQLYEALARVSPGPVVELNRAVAVGMAEGAEAGLALLEALQDRLEGYALLYSTRADLLRRAGRPALHDYQRALALEQNEAGRRYLRRRIGQIKVWP